MTVENVTYISDLEPANPKGGDSIAQGDNHIRNTKLALRNTFPNIDGEVLVSDEELNLIQGLDRPITEIIQGGEDANSDLDSRVTKNEQDIAKNASDIATNASGIAQNASDIASNSSAIALKADKTYVDSENAAQDAVIAQKADKSYVDSQDNALSGRIDSLENADLSHDLNSHTDVDVSGVQAGDALVFDGAKWIAKKAGGNMITPTPQPLTVGPFTYVTNESTWFDYVGDPVYQANASGNWGTVQNWSFNVPAGKVFNFSQIFNNGPVLLDLDSIYIDGKQMYPGLSAGTRLYFDSTDDKYDASGHLDPTLPYTFKSWPGRNFSAPIRVESSIQYKTFGNGNVNNVRTTTAVAGFFSEA